MSSGPAASAWGGKGSPRRRPEPSGPSETRSCPWNLQVLLCPQAKPSPPPFSSAPGSIFLSPKLSPRWSPGHPHSRVLCPACPRSAGPPPQSCTPLLFPSSRTQPRGPLRWAAGRLGWNPGKESSRLRGATARRRRCRTLLEPAASPRHGGLCREWGSGISRLRVLRASGPQVVAGAFAASAARRAPCGPGGAPRVARRLENLPGWRLCERRAFPEDAERLA